MFGLSFRGLVQNGLEIARFQELDADTCKSLGILDNCILASAPTGVANNATSLTDQVKEALPFTFSVDALFKGQSATVDTDLTTDEITVTVPGGLWLVKALWTESGLENGLAFYRNSLIAMGWVFFIIAGAIYWPPIRSMRQNIAQGMVPAALGLAASLAETQKVDDDSDKEDLLVHLLHTFNHGKMAPITIFEPRCGDLLTNDLVSPLHNLLLKTNNAAIGSSLVWSLSKHGYLEIDEDDAAAASTYVTSLRSCAKAIQSSDASALTSDTAAAVSAPSDDPNQKSDDNDDKPAFVFKSISLELEKATTAWIQASTTPCVSVDCSKEGFKNAAKAIFMWWAGPLLVIYSQFAVLYKCHTYRPSIQTILWSIKLTAGFVALFSMTVYWDQYSNFAIEKPGGNVGSVFSGWQLTSYAYVWTPTFEGTIEKGIFRMVGTVAGGFSAWIAVIVCSGSFDDQPNVNPFALTAWLTVTTAIVAWLASDKGISSFAGISYDHGMMAIYFAAVQALVALEVHAGKGDRDDLVSNRIAATVAGAALAILLAAVPPFVKGNDPKMLIDIQAQLDDAFPLYFKRAW